MTDSKVNLPKFPCPSFDSVLGNECLNPVPNEDSTVYKACLKLSNEAYELYLDTTVGVGYGIPSPLAMYRDYIAQNKPLIIKGAVSHWGAVKRWTPSYLRSLLGSKEVTVALTPNGYADAPNGGFFVQPHNEKMKFGDFLTVLENPHTSKGVHYVQKQCSNLTDEFSELMSDLDPEATGEYKWFSEAIGKKPDAVNFWMGDSRAVTSMHKDHYENIYCVISGYKDFTLIAPSDAPFVPYRQYPNAFYRREQQDQDFDIVADEDSSPIPWIAIDPLNPDKDSFPHFDIAKIVRVRVNAGDALYVPSLWFHHVQQSHACIAVNYWHDMEFDIKYNYYQMVKSLTWDSRWL